MALARSLGIPVLAEGIEEPPQQLALLRSELCDEVQGFLLGRPVPVNQLAAQGGPQPSREVARPRWSLTCASTARGGRHADGRLRLSAWPQVCRSH